MTHDHTQNQIDNLLQYVDGSGSDQEWSALEELRVRLNNRLPEKLLALYRKSRKWQVRSACVYHSAKYATTSPSAVELALQALTDKSQVVRYRACLLLACTQDRALLPKLHDMRDRVAEMTKADLDAAIDAIGSQNRNYFVDREHSGLMTLNV